MGQPPKRDKGRSKSPTFLFNTRAINGEPTRDPEGVRRQKDRMIAKFIKQRGVTKLPMRKQGEFL